MLVVAALRKVRDLTTSTTYTLHQCTIDTTCIHTPTYHQNTSFPAIPSYHHSVHTIHILVFTLPNIQLPNSHNSSTPHTYQAYIEHTKPIQWHYLLEDCFVKQWQQANPCRLLVLSMPILLLWLRKQVYT